MLKKLTMPVHDNPVDPRTVKGEGHKYGCNSRKAVKDGYWARDGWYFNSANDVVAKAVWIPHRMSKLCRYDQRANDKGCAGCACESDQEFLKGYGL